jgi:hypothetical protein
LISAWLASAAMRAVMNVRIIGVAMEDSRSPMANRRLPMA